MRQIQVIEYIEREAIKIPAPTCPTVHEIALDPAIWKLQIASRAPQTFTQFKFSLRAFPPLMPRLEIGMNRIAELILRGFGDSDIIIFADQLLRAKIDDRGRVTYDSSAPSP
jgi:hypothetical protein